MALFNVSKGKYGKGTLRENSLIENQLQKPQIYSAMIRLREQYGMTYFTEGTGRVKMVETKQEEWGNNTFEWFIKGRGERPSTVAGAATSGVGAYRFVLPVAENYLNKTETVKLPSGKFAYIRSDAQGSGPYYYEMEIITTDSDGYQLTYAASDTPVGGQISVYSNLNPEKSNKGYSTISYPDKYAQFLSIHRRAFDVSGSALANVAWVENTKTKQSVWYFEAEDEVDKQMLMHMDRWRMYGRRTVAPNGKPFLTMDGKPVWGGDGALTQMEGINEFAYSSNSAVNSDSLSDYIGFLATKSKDFDNNHWVVMTGQRGMTNFHKTFHNSMINNGNYAYSYAHGAPIEMGGNYTSYRIGTNTIGLVHCASFDDEYLHSKRDSDGYLLESSRMAFFNYGRLNNESNVIIAVRKSLNGNRGLIKKYIPGMVDPYNMKLGSLGYNPDDGFEVNYLSESGLVITNPYSCGSWIRTA